MSSPDDLTSDLGFGATLRQFTARQRLFDRYALKEILGRGGMGIVWLAFDEQLERDVALKFLPEMIAFDEHAVADLKRETKKSQELRHHHIVQVYDFVTDKQNACISMEYVDGSTLSAIKARQPQHCFEVDQVRDWVEQLCEALAYAHGRARVVHRDLKPANLMVNGKGDLKITDFGIARSLTDSATMITSQGTSGTLVYMSPQQLDGEKTSHLDDIYSVGATLYELLTSKPPFYSGQVDHQIRKKTPASMAARRAELALGNTAPIPGEWEQTISASLAKDPAQRPQSASEIAYRLRLKGVDYGPTRLTSPASTVLSAMGAPPQLITVPAQPAGKSPSINKMGLIFAVGGFAILFGGLGTYVVMRPGAAPNAVVTTPMPPSVAPSIAIASPSVTSASSVSIPAAAVALKEVATSPASSPSSSANGFDAAGSDQRLTKFTNQKYRCTILVPLTVFTNPPQQLDDEHTTFLSADGRTQLQLIVQRIPQNRPVADIYREWIAERTKGHSSKIISYKVLKENWFVLSGDADGRGYYVKCVARDRSLFCMNLKYDEEMGVIWQDTMTTMSRSFNGDILP
jgi:serine/threonine protein kinase